MRFARAAGMIAKVIVNSLAVIGAAIAVAVVACLVTGIRPVIFVSGSMSPTIGTGALALTAPVAADDIRPGDIISVEREDGIRVTHRAVDVEQDAGGWALTMQGDANASIDADRYDVTAGADRVIWHLDGLGFFVSSLQVPWVFVGAGALLVIALIPGKRKARHASSPGAETPTEVMGHA